MKKTLQILSLILAIGATIQTLQAYISKPEYSSIEEFKYRGTNLIEQKNERAKSHDSSRNIIRKEKNNLLQINSNNQKPILICGEPAI